MRNSGNFINDYALSFFRGDFHFDALYWYIESLCEYSRLLCCTDFTYPATAAAGAAPPQNQGNREARSAIYATYATAAVPIFDHVFFCSS